MVSGVCFLSQGHPSSPLSVSTSLMRVSNVKILTLFPGLFEHLYFFFKLMFHIFRNDLGHVLGDQSYIRGEKGVFKNSRSFGQESNKDNQENRYNQYPFNGSEPGAAYSINPSQKSDVEQIFNDDAQDTDNDDNTKKKDQKTQNE